MAALRDNLEARLDGVNALRYRVEQAMKEAESIDAYSLGPAHKDEAAGMYLQGLQAQQEYKLDQAEESFAAALEAARETLRKARAAREAQMADEKRKAQEKQAQVMKALEEASRLIVVTEDGTIFQPRNWTEQDLRKEIDQGGDRTVVRANEAVEDLLSRARHVWGLGLNENVAGNYAGAQSSFGEALRYIDAYVAYAVKAIYTVRLIPDRRDSLWRIAANKDVYGDPFQWPKIWRRNRKLIRNPDLILPGWQLAIP
jgi:nucleoid-associated protein YgaU